MDRLRSPTDWLRPYMDRLRPYMGPLRELSTALGIPEQIGTAVFSILYSTGGRLLKVEDGAGKLRRTEERIRALLTDSEQRRFVDHDSVKLWLRELRATAFDVDALLDRLNTISRMATAEQSRKRRRPWPNVELGPRQRWELDGKIININERLDEIYKSRKRYRFQAGDGRRTAQPMQCPSFLEAAAHRDERPIGRTKEKEKIVRALISDSGMDLPVISIWGTAGIGKTALARLVYYDPEVENFFTKKIWVWLPDVCDVRRATKMIIEAVTEQKCEFLSLDILQQRLGEHLRKMRFLLVIDNLWAEGFQFWEFLKPSLIAGEKGSKVLITTQQETVTRMMSNILNINLKGLEVEECWQILKVHAFSGWSSNDHHDLELIGQSIAKNCRGSPLAAKSLGVLLSDTNGQREQWENILSEMQILEDGKNTNIILPSLQISYQHLPYHLKQCFAYCSILPLGVEFEKDELVRLWMADGLVKNNGRKRVEMEASRCFDELLRRSFFEPSHNFHNQKFRVPNLMLELARIVSKHESLTLNPDNSQVVDHPEWIRYATILCPEDGPLAFDKIHHYENLRLLKLCPMMKLPSDQVPSALFLKFTCLRALDLSYTELEVLADSVGCLIHLRYLSLRNTLIKTLPEAVCNLINLQTLDLRNCYWLMNLPEGMSRLVNLRHLCLHIDWDRVTAFRSMPSNIDKLQSLQTLCRFVVVTSDGGKCNFSELKNLRIRGELCILKLEAATNDGAKEANLSGKEYLHKLMLKWSDGACTNEQQLHIEESEKVIETLCPHTNLKHLRIDNYPGRNLPYWVEKLSSLESLEIVSCPRLTQFSVETLRSLTNFTIRQCSDLQVLPRGLCNLEALHCLEIDGAPNLLISAVDILPRNISRLAVSGCDALERWCLQEGAERVQQIPDKRIQFSN
ncbi:putative disease resistance protein RGA3 [Phragmites australis]|uniref:putative disease resistance protein RGA3 n=1 Tax=Phragmites australis TaxID=29695 RepID=UPI002D764F4E|nr:putative disease resistance protein RGA3 [Phragmites australis]